MSQPTWNFLRLVNRVLRNMRKPTIDNVRNQTLPRIAQDAIEVIREEYQDFCTLQDWPWLRKSAYLQLNAEQTGTGLVTNGASAFASPSNWDASYQGRKIKFDNHEEEYVILDSSTAITVNLDRPFLGETSATAVGYTIFDDDYALPSDFNRFILVNKFISSGRIRLLGIQEFRDQQYQGRFLAPTYGASSPMYGTIMNSEGALVDDDNEPSAPILLLRPWPKDAISIPYDYIREPAELTSNNSTLAIPNEDVVALIHKVMIIMFGYIEDDTKAQVAEFLWKRKYKEMTGAKTAIDDNMHLYPMNRDRAKFSRARRNRRGGIDYGDAFDRKP